MTCKDCRRYERDECRDNIRPMECSRFIQKGYSFRTRKGRGKKLEDLSFVDVGYKKKGNPSLKIPKQKENK